MHNFYGSNPEEERRLLNLVKDFEARLDRKEIAYIDLLKVKEIFQFYLRHEQLEEAQRLLDYADAFHEKSCLMLRLKALLEIEKKNWEEALHQTEAALSCNPDDTELKFLKTELLAHLNQYDEAMGLLRELLAIDLEPKNVLLQMGNVSQLCGYQQQSEQYYRQALHCAPDFLDAVIELAHLLDAVERPEDGIKVYKSFLDNCPYQSRAWYELGRLYGSLGMIEQAVEAFDFATVIRGDFFMAHYYRGKLLYEHAQYLSALRAFLEANACLSGDDSTWYHIGQCAQRLGAYPLAIRYYQQLSQREAYQFEAWVGLGESLEASERYLEAVHYYRKAYLADKRCEEMALIMARCEFKLGNFNPGYEYLRKALQDQPGSLYLWREWAAFLAGWKGAEAALTFLQEGMAMNPRMGSLYYLSAAYAFQARRTHQAHQLLRNGLLMQPQGYGIMYPIAPAMQQDREIQQLIERYQ